MNRIEALQAKSKFVSEPHLTIAIDGVPLDIALGSDGLVSSLLGWFHNDEDCALPWKRILPDIGCTSYAPVLICPDDLDLDCSVVVAEVVAEAEMVRWQKLGFDASLAQDSVGTTVRWDPNWGPYCFARSEYEACLAAFSPTET